LNWAKITEDSAPFEKLLDHTLIRTGVETNCLPWSNVPTGVRVDRLSTGGGDAFIVTNRTTQAVTLTSDPAIHLRSLFTTQDPTAGQYRIPAGEADLVVPCQWDTNG